MSDGANEKVQVPGGALMAVGLVMTVAYAALAALNGFSLIFSCMGTMGYAIAALDGNSEAMFGAILTIVGLFISALTVLVYIGIAGGGAYAARGGMAMRSLENRALVERCGKLALGLPLAGLVTSVILSLATILQANCMAPCSAVFSAIPHLVLCLVGGGGAYLVHTALQDDSVVSAFKS